MIDQTTRHRIAVALFNRLAVLATDEPYGLQRRALDFLAAYRHDDAEYLVAAMKGPDREELMYSLVAMLDWAWRAECEQLGVDPDEQLSYRLAGLTVDAAMTGVRD